jgi:hypothetical protein
VVLQQSSPSAPAVVVCDPRPGFRLDVASFIALHGADVLPVGDVAEVLALPEMPRLLVIDAGLLGEGAGTLVQAIRARPAGQLSHLVAAGGSIDEPQRVPWGFDARWPLPADPQILATLCLRHLAEVKQPRPEAVQQIRALWDARQGRRRVEDVLGFESWLASAEPSLVQGDPSARYHLVMQLLWDSLRDSSRPWTGA